MQCSCVEGDALGVYPHNSMAEVKDLLVKANLTGDEIVAVDYVRSPGTENMLY